MGALGSRLFSSTYIKIIFATLLILAGVVGGIYLGDAAVRHKTSLTVNGPVTLAPALKMGDVFPLLNYTTLEGKNSTFEELIMGHRTIVMFLSNTCGKCTDLLSSWNVDVAPILDSEVQVVICLRDGSIPSELTRLVGKKPILIPEKALYQFVGLKVTPTVVGIDEYGLIVYLQPGFRDSFGQELYDLFAIKAK